MPYIWSYQNTVEWNKKKAKISKKVLGAVL